MPLLPAARALYEEGWRAAAAAGGLEAAVDEEVAGWDEGESQVGVVEKGWAEVRAAVVGRAAAAARVEREGTQ